MPEEAEKVDRRTAEFEDYLGKTVKAARERRGLSQRALAEILRENGLPIDGSALARIEKRDGTKPRAISFGEAAILASVLDLNLGEVIKRGEPAEQRFATLTRLFDADVDDLRDAMRKLAWRVIRLVGVLQDNHEFAQTLPWLDLDDELSVVFDKFASVAVALRDETNKLWQAYPIGADAVADFQSGVEQIFAAVADQLFVASEPNPIGDDPTDD